MTKSSWTMKREEQIEKYCAENGFPLGSCSSINSVKAQTASDAIRWADETMIEKACQYLYKWNQEQTRKFGAKATLGCSEYTVNVADFRRVMEGDGL